MPAICRHHILGEHFGITPGHINVHVAKPLQAVEHIVSTGERTDSSRSLLESGAVAKVFCFLTCFMITCLGKGFRRIISLRLPWTDLLKKGGQIFELIIFRLPEQDQRHAAVHALRSRIRRGCSIFSLMRYSMRFPGRSLRTRKAYPSVHLKPLGARSGTVL